MVASGPKLSVTNLSQRFTITHMTGSFAHNVMEGIHSLPDYSGLDSRELGASGELEKRQAAGPGGVGGGAAAAGDIPADATGKYTIPYPLQTGATRYAPMAKLPGTTITAKSAIRQYPTSSYEIATTYLHRPTVDITVSASQKYSASSIENTVCSHIGLCK